METVKLTASKGFKYRGKPLKVGDPFEATAKEAALFKKTRFAADAPQAPPPPPLDQPKPDEPEEEAAIMGKVSTKDLTAEDDADDDAPRTKRKYTRRDLEAEK